MPTAVRVGMLDVAVARHAVHRTGATSAPVTSASLALVGNTVAVNIDARAAGKFDRVVQAVAAAVAQAGESPGRCFAHIRAAVCPYYSPSRTSAQRVWQSWFGLLQ